MFLEGIHDYYIGCHKFCIYLMFMKHNMMYTVTFSQQYNNAYLRCDRICHSNHKNVKAFIQENKIAYKFMRH